MPKPSCKLFCIEGGQNVHAQNAGQLIDALYHCRSKAGLKMIPNALCCEDHFHW